MEKRYKPIGVFDTGVGGLTVVKEIIGQLPYEGILYFGDTARMPYGPKSPEEIVRLSAECLSFLVEKGAKLLVIACNTVSSFLDILEPKFSVPVIGVIKAGALSAVRTCRGGPIGIIATEGTVNSGAYPAAIRALDTKAEIHTQAAPLLSPMVEQGRLSPDDTRPVIKTYLQPLLDKSIDTLVLGCTHYPLLQDTISEIAGPDVQIVNPAAETVRQLYAVFKENDLESPGGNPVYRYFVSGNPERFASVGEGFLGHRIKDITVV